MSSIIKRRRITINHILPEYEHNLFQNLSSSTTLLQDPHLDRYKIQNHVVSFIKENGGDIENAFSHTTETSAWWKKFISYVISTENMLKKHSNWKIISNKNDDDEEQRPTKKQCIYSTDFDEEIIVSDYTNFSSLQNSLLTYIPTLPTYPTLFHYQIHPATAMQK